MTTAPTCTVAGEKTFTCVRGCTKTEPISATGHSYESEVTAPTCEAGGYTTYTCACGDSYVADETAALEHDYKPGLAVAPTCTKDGVQTYKCSRCDDTYSEPIPATGHDYTVTKVKPTCTEAGYIEYKCTKGDDTFTVSHEHTNECYKTCTGTPDATHEHEPECYVGKLNNNILRDGWVTCPGGLICWYCHHNWPTFNGEQMIKAYFEGEVVDQIPAWLTMGLKYHPTRPVAQSCTFVGEHTHTDACGLKCEWDALGHDMGDWVQVSDNHPCTADTMFISECQRDNCDYHETKTKPAPGHNPGEEKEVARKEATCTDAGYINYEIRCTECDALIAEAQDILPALEHIWGDWTVTLKPTAETEGEAVRNCKRGCTETKPLPAITVGENGAYVYEVIKAPTCTEKGEGKYTLKAERTISFTVEIDALGHDMGEWYVSVQPTYTKVGEERRDCQRENCEYFETREIAKKNEPITPVGPAKPEVTTKYLNTKDHVAYIIGYTDGTVRPNGNITRAEIATIYFRLLTEENREQFWSTENGFADVNANDWFNLAVSTLDNAGVIVDVKDGNFRPNDSITRAELAVMAAQFCKVTGKLPKASFSDLDKDYWAYDEIALIEYAGWINGYPDGTFRPDNTITRAEAMTIINRMLERAVEEENMLNGMMSFVDCPSSEWFYEAVQEATNSHDYKRSKEKVGDYNYKYEIWTELMEAPNWAAMEQAWIAAR